jgi:uroporphyrinogen decarboxylase
MVDGMNKRERVQAVLNRCAADRLPFVPAVYEHKAGLIGRSPSEVCRSAELLELALREELRTYDPDMLTVGLDVYNVEAEAMGAAVRYFDDSCDVPGIGSQTVSDPENILHLPVPDPESSARFPLFLNVASLLHRELGDEMIIRGAVTGPFTLASELCGLENLLLLCLEKPHAARRVLQHVAALTVGYACAFAARGVIPVLFDSRATPRLASPRLFREVIAPVYRESIFPSLEQAQICYRPLVIGGDTSMVVNELLCLGATQLLCDFDADFDCFVGHCRDARMALRINVDPRLIHRGPPEEIRAACMDLLSRYGDTPGLLFGSGVIAYDCRPEHVLVLKQAVSDFAGSNRLRNRERFQGSPGD